MTTVTIQQNVGGYTGTTDTFLRESRPDREQRSSLNVSSDSADSSGAEIQGLLSFSNIFGDGPGQIPLGSTITSATLTVTVGNGTNTPVSFYRMAQDWTAYASWTWNSFGAGIQTDGSEALSAADFTLARLGTGAQTIDVVSSLQAWSNGAMNFGWLLSSGGTDGLAFSSSEGTSAPVLTVTYDAPINPVPGLTVVQSGGTTVVAEGGAGDTLLIALRSAPTSDVTITVWTTGTDDISIVSTVLTFTVANWQTQQSIALAAINDSLVEGAETFTVTMTASSADAGYNGLSSDVTVGVTDNDVAPPPPGLNVVQSGGTTAVTEGGAGDTFVFALNSAPTSDVTVTLSTTGADDISIAQTILTFTAANWQTQQTVSLSAINDSLVEGPETFTVTMTATSADAGYNGLSSNVTVGVTDNDGFPTVLSPAVVRIHDTRLYTAGDASSVPGCGDPSGIAYIPGLDRLFIVDSEHDESPYYSQTNLFVTTLDGTQVGSFSLRAFTKEPTGIAYNPLNGLLYISDDDADKIFIVNPNNPGTLVGSIDMKPFGITDAEDPKINPVTGHIYMLDGVTRRFFELTETGAFVSSIVLPSAITDAEALAYDPLRDVFYIASGATRGKIFQTDHNGNILASFDLLNAYTNPISGSLPRIKGLELAPSSNPNDGDRMSLYAVDYGTDQRLDGRMFEIDLYSGWLGS